MKRPTKSPKSMNGPGRRGGLLATMIVASFTLSGVGFAQEDCVGLQVTPAKLTQDLVWSHSYDAVIRNCTDEALRVTTTVAGLGHDLDGAPEFLDSNSAEQAIRLTGGGTFTLQPGLERTVRVDAEIQRPARSLYGGVVAEFEPLNRPEGTSVETRSRVASMLLMRGPKPWKRQVKVVDVGVTPNGDGTYAVHAAVENVGDVHVTPSGSVRVVKDGVLLDTIDVGEGTILPGFKRRLVGSWTPPKGLTGRVIFNADVTKPPASGSGVVDFTAGEAAAPAARIVSLIASDADGAFVEVTLANIGTAAITPTIEVVVTEGELERGRMLFPQTEPITPGDMRTVQWEPELADGTYQVTARAVLDEQLLDEKVTGLRLGVVAAPQGGGGMPLWVLILASFLLLGVVGGLMFVVARKRGATPPGPPAPPRAPVRVPAPSHASPAPAPVVESVPPPSAPPPPPSMPGEAWPTRAPMDDPEDKPVPVGTTNAVAREPMIVLRLRR